jgi:hypothetical protein
LEGLVGELVEIIRGAEVVVLPGGFEAAGVGKAADGEGGVGELPQKPVF